MAPQQAVAIVAKFSGTMVQVNVGTSETYLSDTGELAPSPFINDGVPQRYGTSARTISRLRVTAKSGTGTGNMTVTLYKNGAPTAMVVVIPSGSPANTKGYDGAHPIVFADGDDFDCHVQIPNGVGDGPFFLSVTLEGPIPGP